VVVGLCTDGIIERGDGAGDIEIITECCSEFGKCKFKRTVVTGFVWS
jgi:hypothetical protein